MELVFQRLNTTVSAIIIILSFFTASKVATKRTLIIVAIISSLAAFVTGSVLFFTVGCVCGHCSEKRTCMFCTKSNSSENDQDGTSQDNTCYEDILLKQKFNDENLQLKQNVAYGPITAIIK